MALLGQQDHSVTNIAAANIVLTADRLCQASARRSVPAAPGAAASPHAPNTRRTAGSRAAKQLAPSVYAATSVLRWSPLGKVGSCECSSWPTDVRPYDYNFAYSNMRVKPKSGECGIWSARVAAAPRDGRRRALATKGMGPDRPAVTPSGPQRGDLHLGNTIASPYKCCRKCRFDDAPQHVCGRRSWGDHQAAV